MRRHRHLDDAALLELIGLEPDASAPPEAPACPACQRRLEDLRAWLDALRGDGLLEADRSFSAERLARQRDQIRRRLESVYRPARVLRFPVRARPAAAARPRPGRWVAAAAAAGLVAGVAAGALLDLRPPGGIRSAQTPVPAAAPEAETVMLDPWPDIASETLQGDELFLWQIDAALDAPRARALEPLDAFTPRVVDLAYFPY